MIRREISVEERDYLLREGIVTRPMCNLGRKFYLHFTIIFSFFFISGLTALRSAEVMDLMASEYAEKYAEYQKVVAEREKQTLANKLKEYETVCNLKLQVVKITK